MSTLAKVFIVVNLFLTGTYVFLVASLLAQKNDYREKLREKQNETKTMVTDKENEIKVRKEEIEGVKQEISVKLDEIQKEKLLTENARSHIRILEDRKAEKEQKLPEVEKIQRELEDQIAKKEKDNRDLRNQKDALEQLFSQMQDEQQQGVSAKDGVQEELKTVYARVTEISEELASEQDKLGATGFHGTHLTFRDLKHTAGPDIDGKIVAISPGSNQVMINVGESKSVALKTMFIVFRGNDYIGRIEVEQVFPEMSAARIVERGPGAQIQEGDNASTRLK
ncbi:MAG: hypothetical protein AABZ60_06610 [Planctomycetota bacterium]